MVRSVRRWVMGLAAVLVLAVAVWQIWAAALARLPAAGAVLTEAIDPWYPIQVDEAGYAVEMPTKPIDTMTDLAQGIRAYGWTLNRDHYWIGVYYADLPGASDPQKAFAAMAEGFSHAQGVKRLIAQRSITLDGYPGLELEYEFNAAQTGVVRMYVKNDRFHYLQFLTDDWEGTRGMRERFFNSFHFLPPEVKKY